jgi:hypothetical protein
MTPTQIRQVFPYFADWDNPKKDELRLRALRMIPKDDLIILCKLAEVIEEKYFTIENIKWMYLFSDENDRKRIIKGYKEIIDDINKGKVNA